MDAPGPPSEPALLDDVQALRARALQTIARSPQLPTLPTPRELASPSNASALAAERSEKDMADAIVALSAHLGVRAMPTDLAIPPALAPLLAGLRDTIVQLRADNSSLRSERDAAIAASSGPASSSSSSSAAALAASRASTLHARLRTLTEENEALYEALASGRVAELERELEAARTRLERVDDVLERDRVLIRALETECDDLATVIRDLRNGRDAAMTDAGGDAQGSRKRRRGTDASDRPAAPRMEQSGSFDAAPAQQAYDRARSSRGGRNHKPQPDDGWSARPGPPNRHPSPGPSSSRRSRSPPPRSPPPRRAPVRSPSPPPRRARSPQPRRDSATSRPCSPERRWEAEPPPPPRRRSPAPDERRYERSQSPRRPPRSPPRDSPPMPPRQRSVAERLAPGLIRDRGGERESSRRGEANGRGAERGRELSPPPVSIRGAAHGEGRSRRR